MTLPASGPISLNNVNVELGLSGTTSINMNQASVRTLFAVPSGAISMSNGYGKSNRSVISHTFASNTANASLNVTSISGYTAGTSDITITVNSSVYLYSTSTGTPGLTLSGGSAGDTVTLVNNGFIVGMGGAGGGAGSAGAAGGIALQLGFNTTINNTNGSAYIGGGGGGGGAGVTVCGAGGGGAGGGAGGNSGGSPAASGGAGGGVGASGSNGSVVSFNECCNTYYRGGGGGGGRIFAGSGGAGGRGQTQPYSSNAPGAGGGSGGGGGTLAGANFNNAGAGGSANASGGAASGGGQVSAGGGGGWGASGGTGSSGGGSGGKAVNLNGKTATFVSSDTTRVYGSVS